MRWQRLADRTDFAIENLSRRREMASRGGVTDDNVKQVRAIIGPGPSDMDIIRALYQSKNDVSSALNILFDTPSWHFKPRLKTVNRGASANNVSSSSESKKVTVARDPSNQIRSTPTENFVRVSTADGNLRAIPPVAAVVDVGVLAGDKRNVGQDLSVLQSQVLVQTRAEIDRNPITDGTVQTRVEIDRNPITDGKVQSLAEIDRNPITDGKVQPQAEIDRNPITDGKVQTRAEIDRNPMTDCKAPVEVIDLSSKDSGNKLNTGPTQSAESASAKPRVSVKRKFEQTVTSPEDVSSYDDFVEPAARSQVSPPSEGFVLMGQTSVTCLSTCRGMKLTAGEQLTFSFPKAGYDSSLEAKRGWGGRGKGAAAAADIVRFSTKKSGEIGRLPGEWARPLIPLVSAKKVAISASCIYCPPVLGVLDSIHLELRIFVSEELLKKHSASSATSISVSAEASTHNPLLSVLRLLKKKPFKKAEFSPEDIYNRKRSLDLETAKKNGVPASEPVLPLEKREKLSSRTAPPSEENEPEEISEEDLTKIVGTSEGSELSELDPPTTLVCELRPYQKQALFWMTKMESGLDIEDAAKTLHPCWEAYYLGDEKSVFYVNIFSGEASLDFPSALQTARGGILADAMGLGKTVMAIALMLASPGRGGLYSASPAEREGANSDAIVAISPSPPKGGVNVEGITEQPRKGQSTTPNGLQTGGGTLIVCPMTLLGQWKTELETHVKPGLISVLTYYGPDRMKDFKSFLDYDVVLTTYGVLSSDSNNQTSSPGASGLFGIHWFRIILDEAHTIKGLRTQMSQAAFKLTADCRWCLTGTPIQNKLEDVYSLLHFLRIEPWGNFGWWTKLIQKPFDEGDERGLRLLQAILKPLMLRRTKETVDKEGRPILVLPPADMQIIECELSEAERDFYDALFRRSKVKFDMFVEQGRVLHNYASILELLLRLRQCCDHPFLVMSRGDTDEFADLKKLARHFMNEDSGHGGGPSRAFVEEVVNDIRKGEKAECPICLEAVEDAVLTPCAHCMCRECLFASWPGPGGGSCPICRKYVSRQDLITAPKESRFHLDVEKNWRASSKVEALMKELEKVGLAGEKSVVFSQWTSFLDLLQIPLNREKIKYVRLDGSLSQHKREEVIKEFSVDPNIKVMLISLKAGGVGVNLTAASHAFLLDPWWNPAVEEQAIMRIHRIGQAKNVFIRRFICKNTVEERMQQVQARKQRMIAGALNNQEVRAARLEELKMLFR